MGNTYNSKTWIIDEFPYKSINLSDKLCSTGKILLMIISIIDVKSHMIINSEAVKSKAPYYTISAIQNAVNYYGTPSHFIAYSRGLYLDDIVYKYMSNLNATFKYISYKEKDKYNFVNQWSKIVKFSLNLDTHQRYNIKDITIELNDISENYNNTPQECLNYFPPLFHYTVFS